MTSISCLPQNAASRRYQFRFFIAMAFYVLILFADTWGFRHSHFTGPLAYVLAVLPAIPILAVLAIVALYLTEEKDEFQRNVLIESMLVATGLTLAFTTVWGFLELFTPITHFQPYLVFPLFWFVVGVSTPFLKRRYR